MEYDQGGGSVLSAIIMFYLAFLNISQETQNSHNSTVNTLFWHYKFFSVGTKYDQTFSR